MKWLFASVLSIAFILAGPVSAQQTSYRFTSSTYSASKISNAPCAGVGDCTTLTTDHRAVITLTFDNPLAPNLLMGDRASKIISYSFDTGTEYVSGPSSQTHIVRAILGTDSSGLPDKMNLILQKSAGPPYNITSDTDPNARMTQVHITTDATATSVNWLCRERDGRDHDANACTGFVPSTGSSEGEVEIAPTVTKLIAEPIPTLSEWTMIGIGVLMAMGGGLMLMRRRGAMTV